MATHTVHQLAQCITCLAWSPDHAMVAFCPNNNEVHICRLLSDKSETVHVLRKIRWNQEGSEWVPTLVIRRLNRAALCVQWSPKENEFAVGSGTKTVCISYYEQENNRFFWQLHQQMENVKFSTFIKGVDSKDSASSLTSDSKFGEVIIPHCTLLKMLVPFHLLKTLHSMIYLFVMWLLFVNERSVIGVGVNCNPLVFMADERSILGFVRFLGENKVAPSSSKYGSQLSGTLGKLYGQPKHGVNNDAVEASRARGGAHDNCIMQVPKLVAMILFCFGFLAFSCIFSLKEYTKIIIINDLLEEYSASKESTGDFREAI